MTNVMQKFFVSVSIYNSLHVSSTSCSSSGERNFINTASGNSHSMLVAEMCAGVRVPLHSRRSLRANVYILSKWVSLQDVGFLFVTSLKSNLGTVLTTYNTAENNCIISHAQNTTAFKASELLTGVHRVLVTNKGLLGFSSTNNSQGQLQTTQSISIIMSTLQVWAKFAWILWRM
jgi:hypothetical protein